MPVANVDEASMSPEGMGTLVAEVAELLATRIAKRPEMLRRFILTAPTDRTPGMTMDEKFRDSLE